MWNVRKRVKEHISNEIRNIVAEYLGGEVETIKIRDPSKILIIVPSDTPADVFDSYVRLVEESGALGVISSDGVKVLEFE